MDIDQNVNSIVQTIISQITTQVQQQVAAQIDQKITDIIANLDTTAVLADQLGKKLDAKISQLPIDIKSIESTLTTRLDALATNLSAAVQAKSVAAATESINAQVNRIDFQQLCQAVLNNAIQNQTFTYPESSIPGSAIDSTNWSISGNNVSGGIIRNFGSSGIDDKALTCQLSIFDSVTVVENNLVTKDLTVKGTTTIEGNLNVTGTMPEDSPLFKNVVRAASNEVRLNLDQVVFKSYADMVFQQIKQEGLDLNQITVNGQEIVNGPNLGMSIINSNLQRVGQLQELQVSGESFLSGTLYTTSKRAGINTIEPAQALSVWDQEIEIGFGKKENNTAIIGTPRSQTLIVGSNGKNNLILTPDGATTVNKINMGTMSFTVGAMPPTDNQPRGSIVFNSNPSLGGPLGWVSLGDARWANFGIID